MDQLAQVEAIRGLSGAQREQAVTAFLSRPDVTRLMWQVAVSLAHRYRINVRADGQDVAAEVSVVALAIMQDDATFAQAAELRSWARALSLLSQNVIRAQVDRGVYSGGLTGVSTRLRRGRALACTHAHMLAGGAAGANPTTQAVVAVHNAGVLARLKDPARQGALAREADLVPLAALALDPALDPLLAAMGARSESDCPLVAWEARAVIREGVARCRAASQVLGAAAQAMYGSAVQPDPGGDPPFIGGVAEVAAAAGVTARDARAAIRLVNAVMRQVLADLFGVSGADG